MMLCIWVQMVSIAHGTSFRTNHESCSSTWQLTKLVTYLLFINIPSGEACYNTFCLSVCRGRHKMHLRLQHLAHLLEIYRGKVSLHYRYIELDVTFTASGVTLLQDLAWLWLCYYFWCHQWGLWHIFCSVWLLNYKINFSAFIILRNKSIFIYFNSNTLN